jgi:hypothetical protein
MAISYLCVEENNTEIGYIVHAVKSTREKAELFVEESNKIWNNYILEQEELYKTNPLDGERKEEFMAMIRKNTFNEQPECIDYFNKCNEFHNKYKKVFIITDILEFEID